MYRIVAQEPAAVVFHVKTPTAVEKDLIVRGERKENITQMANHFVWHAPTTWTQRAVESCRQHRLVIQQIQAYPLVIQQVNEVEMAPLVIQQIQAYPLVIQQIQAYPLVIQQQEAEILITHALYL
ncbi:hypothetical protein [Tautonia rosea]|uniref:hypothetical protein n=1 Tax=Tautonia rosea TaxID=2728037 RepID=UPI00147519A9|nr:hypothetical protein [Tautonia rosea]